MRTYVVDPAALGLRPVAARRCCAAATPATNADLARRVLDGEPGPHRDIVVLNAAAAIVVAGLADDLHDGLAVAARSVDEGRAGEVLERLVHVSKDAAER